MERTNKGGEADCAGATDGDERTGAPDGGAVMWRAAGLDRGCAAGDSSATNDWLEQCEEVF